MIYEVFGSFYKLSTLLYIEMGKIMKFGDFENQNLIHENHYFQNQNTLKAKKRIKSYL